MQFLQQSNSKPDLNFVFALNFVRLMMYLLGKPQNRVCGYVYRYS